MNKVLLLNSFGLFPSIPPYSTAYVTSLLRKNSIQVKHMDLSLEIWNYILSEKYLKGREFKEKNLRNSSFALCPKINEKTFNVIRDNVTENIEKAKSILRNKESLKDINKLLWSVNILFESQKLIYYNYGTFIGDKVKYYPEMGFNVHSINKIYELSEDEQHNPFIEIFKYLIIPKIKEINPGIIGVNMMWEWDIIPALTLNKLIKKSLPDTHINFVGHGYDEFCFARLKDRFKEDGRLFFNFDSVFLVRNDSALLNLMGLDTFSGDNLKDIPSIAYKTEESTVINGPFFEGNINFSIEPDYSDLELKQYLTPNIMLAEILSSKCFWSRCYYCGINKHKSKRQEIDLEHLIQRLHNYRNLYNCKHILLADESVSVEQITNFVAKLEKCELEIIWSVRTRVNEKIDYNLLKRMHNTGCREVWVGVETLSEEMLRFINKTEKPDSYKETFLKLMKDCDEIGIGLHICLMFNIPSQNELHYNEVINFFEENEKYISRKPFFATFNRFQLMQDSEMLKEPHKFHIKEVIIDKDNFGMTAIPYKSTFQENPLSQDVMKKLDIIVYKLIGIFVKKDALKLLWLFSSIHLEVFLKEEYTNENPFQKRATPVDKIFMKMYIWLGKYPFFLKWLNKILAKKY